MADKKKSAKKTEKKADKDDKFGGKRAPAFGGKKGKK